MKQIVQLMKEIYEAGYELRIAPFHESISVYNKRLDKGTHTHMDFSGNESYEEDLLKCLCCLLEFINEKK